MKQISWSLLLFELQATQATQCISLNADEDSDVNADEDSDADAEEFNFEILMNGLANMKELRFLYVNVYVSEDEVRKWKFDEDSLHLPNALRFLKWDYGYPFSSLPKTFQPNNLVLLDMSLSRMVQLWKDGEEKPFLKLRFLKFYCDNLRTLDLSVAPNLETLILEQCYSLVEVHFQVTPNLKELRIYNCTSLEKLHMPAKCPKLRSLNLSDLWDLRTLHLGVTPNLETLIVRYCPDFVELQIPAECPNLVNLDLSNCPQVAELPEEIGRLECLKELDITGTGISHLPDNIFRIKGLRIFGPRELLESCGFSSEIETSDGKTFCYI